MNRLISLCGSEGEHGEFRELPKLNDKGCTILDLPILLNQRGTHDLLDDNRPRNPVDLIPSFLDNRDTASQ